MKPAGSTPVMTDTERNITLIDSKAICEDFEETIEKFPLISGGASGRAEIRRLVAWFDENFYGDVVAPMLHERMRKRLIDRAAPDARILREAMKRANRSEEHTSELQSLMRISYAVFCLKKKNTDNHSNNKHHNNK